MAKEVNQIRDNVVCVVARLVFVFFCAFVVMLISSCDCSEDFYTTRIQGLKFFEDTMGRPAAFLF